MKAEVTLDELVRDYEPCGDALRRKDAGPTSPSPVLSAADVLRVAGRERDEKKALNDLLVTHYSRECEAAQEERLRAEVARLTEDLSSAEAKLADIGRLCGQSSKEGVLSAVKRMVRQRAGALDLTCKCSNDPEFPVLGHAEWCVLRKKEN